MIISGKILKKAIKDSGLTQLEAANILGVSRQTLNTWCGKSDLDADVIDIVKTKMKVDLTELFKAEDVVRLEALPLRLADPFGLEATGDKIYELADGSLMMEVPIIPIRAQAGYVHNYKYPEFYEELATIPVMINKKAFSTYMAFEVKGDSMVNLSNYDLADKSIFPGRIAVGRLLDKSKWSSRLHTHNYDAWIIVHREKGIVCKEIIDHDVEKGLITIHSLNPEYQDEVWNLEEVDQIFSIVKIDQNKR